MQTHVHVAVDGCISRRDAIRFANTRNTPPSPPATIALKGQHSALFNCVQSARNLRHMHIIRMMGVTCLTTDEPIAVSC